MKVAWGLLIFVLSAADCSAQPVRERTASASQIPVALHGCWELRYAPDEELPDGVFETMIVKADRIVVDSNNADRAVGTIEKVDDLGPRMIDGLMSARERNGRATMATGLELDPEGAPAGTLRLREGDAGSYDFPRCGPEKARAMERYSLVIAKTSRQDDPRPAPCGPDGSCGDFLYRAEFHDARTIGGAELPSRFDARLKLHTPYISAYTLALIAERQKDGTRLVRRQAGFNGRNGLACFRNADEWPVGWKPEEVFAVRYDHGDLCVLDRSQIDPRAPKD